MPGVQLLELPNELLERILDELDASIIPNPYHCLAITSKALSRIALPYLYESITVRNRAQLESLVNKRTSGAWKLPSSVRIRHLSLHVVSLDLFELFIGSNGHISIHPTIRKLAELVRASATGQLETLKVRIEPLVGILPTETEEHGHELQPGHDHEQADEVNHRADGIEIDGENEQAHHYWHNHFCPCFLTIPARTIECTHADALIEEAKHNFDISLSCLVVSDLLTQNPCVKHLRLPCLELSCDGVDQLVSCLRTEARKITRLQHDWPKFLRIKTLLTLLLGLEDTLEEKGLIIASPATHPSLHHTPDYLSRQFYLQNSCMPSKRCMPTLLHDILARKGAAYEPMASKLRLANPGAQTCCYIAEQPARSEAASVVEQRARGQARPDSLGDTERYSTVSG